MSSAKAKDSKYVDIEAACSDDDAGTCQDCGEEVQQCSCEDDVCIVETTPPLKQPKVKPQRPVRASAAAGADIRRYVSSAASAAAASLSGAPVPAISALDIKHSGAIAAGAAVAAAAVPATPVDYASLLTALYPRQSDYELVLRDLAANGPAYVHRHYMLCKSTMYGLWRDCGAYGDATVFMDFAL